MSRKTSLLLALIGALVIASGAAGYTLARSAPPVNVRQGQYAYFQLRGSQTGWQCLNRSTRVTCKSGDAYPNVELTTTSGGITVKVFTLKDPQGGHVNRSYAAGGYPVYVFTAF